MKKTKLFLLGGLLGLLGLTACNAARPVAPAAPQTGYISLPTPAPSGQAVVYDDLQVVMSAAEITTGYVTEYGSRREPPAGENFLWVHVLLKNTGQRERKLPAPEHFSALYGATEFKPGYGHRKNYADYAALAPVVYQGQAVDAWLRFDLPAAAKLKDLQFAFLPESYQISIAFSPGKYPWGAHPIYLWMCAP